MIALQTNIAVDAITTLEWGWLNHDIPLWVTLIFAFTKPYMWSQKLSTITNNAIERVGDDSNTDESNK